MAKLTQKQQADIKLNRAKLDEQLAKSRATIDEQQSMIREAKRKWSNVSQAVAYGVSPNYIFKVLSK